ncbi:hypothetical protein EC991_009341 [Linnemannia zychae]|nr:hypothetical protein EC991_009341 [Linnemannia zychae]
MQRTSSTRTSSTTSAGRSRTALTAAKSITGTNPTPRFNIGTSTTASSRTPSEGPYSFAGLLSSKKGLVSLSTVTSTADLATETTTTTDSTHRFSFGDASDNPFLEQPPRKQFKDAPPQSSTASQHTSREVSTKSSISQELSTPPGLVLTRVLPINSPARIPAAALTQTVKNPSSTAVPQDPDVVEELSKDAGIIGDTLRKSLRTTAMDIARKSIMQHAAASPRKAFLKVSEVAARSHGEPSLHDLLAASETDDDDYSRPSRPVKPVSTQSFAHPNTPFTFESTPLPPLNPTSSLQEPNIHHNQELPDQKSSTRVGHSAAEKTDDLQPLHERKPLESSFHVRASMASRAAPYRILSVNEREVLRSSRGPGFRARPVNPKMFTNAGETGIPKVVKAPLTIPVSPVFSKRVRTKTTAASTTVTTAKSSLRKGPIRTAAFQRLVNITKPGQNKDIGKDAPPRSSGVTYKSSSLQERPNSGVEHPVEPVLVPSATSASDSSKVHVRGPTTVLYPPATTDQQHRSIGSSSIFRPPATTAPRSTTLGPPLRGGAPSTTSAHNAIASVPGRKPVTHPMPFSFATDKLHRDGHSTTAAAATAASAHNQTIVRPAAVKYMAPLAVHSKKSVTHPVPFKFATDELRREGHGHGHGATAVPNTTVVTERSTTPRHTAAPTVHSRRPLTHPLPFKFATDDILRRRHVMFQSRGASASAASAKPSAATAIDKPKPANAGVFKRSQPLKRLTTPVPFHLATQRRAEVRPPVTRPTQTLDTTTSAASIRTPPRRSRLTGIFPVPTGHPMLTSSARIEKPHFVPTVAISPKLGRHVPVPSLRPTQFVLRKSTKELTQPHEFQFHSDQRAREREDYERRQSIRKREQELLDLQQKADKLHQASAYTCRLCVEREQRMRMRESMERTFRARPITHYQPTVIHKATRALTKPVSPMIGEKRKRYEMEQQILEQQRQEEDYEYHQQQQKQQLGYSQGHQNETFHSDSNAISSLTADSVPDYEVYKSFEEAKLLQAQQQSLQQQLTAQERRQVVLANSSRATIHQPPIRLSFPMDPETEALQVDDTPRHIPEGDVSDDETPVTSSSSATASAGRSQPQPLPPVRDSFGGSNNHRLSRELRRISLEAGRRNSGERGGRSRLSDNFSRRSASSAGSRKSVENGGAFREYYPFTKSQERTSASSDILTALRTTATTTGAAPSSATAATTTTARLVTSSAAVIVSSIPAVAASRQPATTTITSTTPAAETAPPSTTYRATTALGQEKEERRRRSGSFISLEPAVKPTSSPKSSRLSRLFGAPPASSATRLYGDLKQSGEAATSSSSSLSRSKGPVVIEHTLTLSDL